MRLSFFWLLLLKGDSYGSNENKKGDGSDGFGDDVDEHGYGMKKNCECKKLKRRSCERRRIIDLMVVDVDDIDNFDFVSAVAVVAVISIVDDGVDGYASTCPSSHLPLEL